jgi:hypothetical protein
MIVEIRRLRGIAKLAVEHSTLVDHPDGPRVLINYEDFKRLSAVVEDAERGEDDW